MNILKKLTPIFFLFFFIFLSLKRTDGFTTHLITHFKKYEKDKNISIENINFSKIENILSQKFYYYMRGRECFIFISEDQKHILKFFDSSRYDVTFFFPKLKMPNFLDKYRKKHFNRRIKKLDFNLSSAKLAFENLKEDSALEYININDRGFFSKKITIVNRYKKEFLLDLNNIFFILQKKCDIFYKCYENTKDEKYKNYLIFSFLEMVHNRTKKLIIDDDIGKKRRNWGLYNNKAVTIDIGRWYFDEKLKTPQGYKKEMLKATKILRKYLENNEPLKLSMVNEKLKKYFQAFKEEYYLKCSENQSIAN